MGDLDEIISLYIEDAVTVVGGKRKHIAPLVAGPIHIPGETNLQAFTAGQLFFRDETCANSSRELVSRDGHVRKVYSVAKQGKRSLRHRLNEKCGSGGLDTYVMQVSATKGTVNLRVEGDQSESAIAKVKAITLAAFFSVVATKTFAQPGLFYAEDIAFIDELYLHILDKLRTKAIVYNEAQPFMGVTNE